MKKKIISFFKKNPGRDFKSKEIAKKLDLTSDYEYEALKSTLYSLFEEGVLLRTGKNYRLNRIPSSNMVKGELQIVNGGFGFVLVKDSKMGDIFVSSRNMGTAFNGDTVEVSLFANQKGKNIEGQIINVVKRNKEEIVGTLHKSKSFYFVKPDDTSFHRDIYIDKEELAGAIEGDKVIAGKINWDSSMMNPEGRIIEVLGKSGSFDTEVASIAKEFELPYKFTNNVLDEAEKIEEKISEDEIRKRLDYRDKVVFTIDPEDAKDFDDALSIEELENGNISIGVHIADVSHYVQYNSEIDGSAFTRGNSVYLVGRVIPMLPEKLSNNICSLVPNRERLTYSVIVELTKRGKLVNYEIKKSVINSKRRFTYDEVQDIIESGSGDFYNEVLKLNRLAEILRKKRLKEGSIEFSTPEVKFVLDENGNPTRIYRKEIKQSNMLVEEFMLLANQLTAKHIAAPEKGEPKPFIYRIHDLPDNEKIIEFGKFVKSLGYTFNPSASSKSNQFQALIEEVKGSQEEVLINELAIRSMAKAIYSAKNIGHYGLGFKYYTHFTSPIRRYSDLIVHRLLYKYIESKSAVHYNQSQLEEISEHISACERNAVDAERLSVKIKQIEYLQNHIGDEFEALISGITHFGIFVKISNILAEGLIRLRDLEGDFYVYDEKKYALIGKRTKKQFRLGDKITVRLIKADMEKLELDFIIIE
ncbi:MAG TPA: ribonuclease R [Ignavibacteriaceae bacterium]|nr:ribonuclease R [Ignavibacteriaceae bacterium]